MVRNRSLLAIFSLGLISIIAVALSYISVSSFKTEVIGSLSCIGNEADLKVVSEGGKVRVYYVSVIEGDRVVELRRIGTILSEGRSLNLRLELPQGSRVSVLLDKGVIPNLSCGEKGRSQP